MFYSSWLVGGQYCPREGAGVWWEGECPDSVDTILTRVYDTSIRRLNWKLIDTSWLKMSLNAADWIATILRDYSSISLLRCNTIRSELQYWPSRRAKFGEYTWHLGHFRSSTQHVDCCLLMAMYDFLLVFNSDLAGIVVEL